MGLGERPADKCSRRALSIRVRAQTHKVGELMAQNGIVLHVFGVRVVMRGLRI